MDTFETVYYSLLGELEEGYALRWVENAFAPGSECDRAYSRIDAARERLYARLGCDTDPDVEEILSSQLEIQLTLCRKMFACGRRIPECPGAG